MFSRLIRSLAVAGPATAAPGVAAADATVVETFPFSSVQFNHAQMAKPFWSEAPGL
jgi:hypothetical protein